MPLYKTITLDEVTKVLIWKIEEDFEWLSKDVKLTTHCQNRVDGMKSVLHKRGFMSVRHLLLEAGYTDFDLFYDKFGKQALSGGAGGGGGSGSLNGVDNTGGGGAAMVGRGGSGIVVIRYDVDQ